MFDSYRDSMVTRRMPSLERAASWPSLCAVAAIAVSTIFAVGCGKEGFAAGAPPGASAETVIERFGEPDHKLANPPFVESLTPSQCPSKERITSGWIYSPYFYDDAVIYFDAAKRVVCVREGGVIIHMVHV